VTERTERTERTEKEGMEREGTRGVWCSDQAATIFHN